MVVYFRKLNTILIVLFAVLGGIVGFYVDGGRLVEPGPPVKMFVFLICIFIGIIIGRIVSAKIANKKLGEIYKILYIDTKPLEFLRKFVPMNRKVPKSLGEYTDGAVKISFAYEAVGEFEKAIDEIKDIDTLSLKLHSLNVTALKINQMLNLYILKRDRDLAIKELEKLTEVYNVSEKRAKMLYENLKSCIKLAKIRISALEGDIETDIDYLIEEAKLSTNMIHRKEMLLEIAAFYERTGNKEEAVKYYEKILESDFGLWTEDEAKFKMKTINL